MKINIHFKMNRIKQKWKNQGRKKVLNRSTDHRYSGRVLEWKWRIYMRLNYNGLHHPVTAGETAT